MDAALSGRTPGLSLRWVEVTDERGRSRPEMCWSEAAAPALPVGPALGATSKPAVTSAV